VAIWILILSWISPLPVPVIGFHFGVSPLPNGIGSY
jgi:hypothetical protein